MTQNRNFKPSIDFIYNPDNQSKQELIDSFVVRLKTFERLFADIKGAKMKSPEQHYLIEGKRGMGKTTLLLRLGYEIECDKKLNSWLLPIVFNEEEYSIRKLFKLWERIAQLMEEGSKEFIGLFDEMDASFSNYESPEEYEYEMFNLLNQRLEEKGKKLILFIDNFGDIFQKFNKQEVQRLRTVLQTNTNLRLVVASSKVLEAFYDSKHPFYELFKIKRLRGLDKEETNELLLKLGETYKQNQIKEILENQKGRVEALRRLTGGVIRTIVLLFEIFMDKKEGSAFSDLESILDRVTPLYKHRMDDLPAQQQEIVEAIAFAWDAINVSEISQKTRIVSKTVSAQLRQMEKNEIIQKKLTSNKNHFYQVSERFFNIWYLMRHGRKGDKRKVLWLVRFLEEWCDEGELVERADRHIKMLRKGKYNLNGAYYLTEALASTKALPSEKQDELLKTTRDFLKKNNSEFVGHLSESDLEIHDRAILLYEGDEFQTALNLFLEMRKIDNFRIAYCYNELKDYKKAEKYYLMAIENDDVDAINNLAVLYADELKDYKKAEKYYLMAIENDDVDAMNNLGNLYTEKLKVYIKAEKYYLMAIEKDDVNALNNLGSLYSEKLKDYKKAEKYFLKAIEKNDTDAMNNIAIFYADELEDYKKAEKYYLMAVKNDDLNAMNNVGILYAEKLKDYKKAEKYFLKAIEKNDTDAMNNIAIFYADELEDYKKAEKYFLKAVENKNESAIFNLGLFYKKKLKDYKKAEKCYLMAVENKNVRAMFNLGLLYTNEIVDYEQAIKYYLMAIENDDDEAKNNLAIIYAEQKDYTKAEKYFIQAVENKSIKAMINIGYFYQKKFKNFDKAKKYYLMAIDNDNLNALNKLAHLYYSTRMNKIEALELAEKSYKNENENDETFRLTFAQILLWNDKIEKSKTIANQFLFDERYLKEYIGDLKEYLFLLLAKNQYQFLYDYFTSPKAEELNIKDQLKPIWYALMYFMQDKYPNEYLRMGEELEETVNEIIKKVEQMRIDYA